jgi:hypothetical protein
VRRGERVELGLVSWARVETRAQPMRTLLSLAGAVVMVPVVPDAVPLPAVRHAVPGLVSGTG